MFVTLLRQGHIGFNGMMNQYFSVAVKVRVRVRLRIVIGVKSRIGCSCVSISRDVCSDEVFGACS